MKAALEIEANHLLREAATIAREVFDPREPGTGAVVTADSTLHDAFGGGTPAESIERYTSNLLRSIDRARASGCGLVIW